MKRPFAGIALPYREGFSKAGQSTATIKIVPLAGGPEHGALSVKVTLQSGADYNAGSPATAKAKVLDDPVP